jgi:hypothetical protein
MVKQNIIIKMEAFSNEFASAFDIMIYVFGIIEMIVVTIFMVFIVWYIQKLEKSADLLSVATFFFIIIGVIIRIAPKLTIMILVHKETSLSLIQYESQPSVTEDDFYICTVSMSQLISRLLLKVAFMINSLRWVETVL